MLLYLWEEFNSFIKSAKSIDIPNRVMQSENNFFSFFIDKNSALINTGNTYQNEQKFFVLHTNLCHF